MTTIAVVIIIILVLVIAVLTIYNMSIHKKIQDFQNLHQKVSNLNIIQEFINIAGNNMSVDQKIEAMNEVIVEKYEVKYSTIVIFDGSDYVIKATNVDQKHWDVLSTLNELDIFKDSILSTNPKYITVDSDTPSNTFNTTAGKPAEIIQLTLLMDPGRFAQLQLTGNGNGNGNAIQIFDIGPARPVGSFCNDCTLPATGFSGRVATKLSEQPASVNYTNLNMRVQIPSLNVDAEIATVPVVDNAWAVEWLGDKAGLLSGTYLPGEGTTILAGHNTLNTTEWGPFAMLATLDVNDAIFVTDANNEMKSFRVYANELLGPNDMEKLASIAETFENSLVLVTCENEAVSGGYMNRRVVFAKPN